MNEKEEYIQFSEQTPELPLFLQPWWLDAVTQPDGKEWTVLLARNKNGEIEAVMPFVYGSKFGMRYALTPQLTQYTGVWIVGKEGECITDRLSREKKLQHDIIQQLDALHLSFFDVRFPLTYTYWSPFYWAGYKQETHYTYRLENLRDLDKIFACFDSTKQNKIRKAQSSGIVIDFDMSADEFYNLQCLQLDNRGSKDVLSRALVHSVVEKSRNREQGLIARAKDREGNTHSAIYIVWDSHCAYDLITAIHPKFRSSGASTLMIWETTKHIQHKTCVWDFEGSMIESVESSFRQFGATPTPYFSITKQSKFFNFIQLCKR